MLRVALLDENICSSKKREKINSGSGDCSLKMLSHALSWHQKLGLVSLLIRECHFTWQMGIGPPMSMRQGLFSETTGTWSWVSIPSYVEGVDLPNFMDYMWSSFKLFCEGFYSGFCDETTLVLVLFQEQKYLLSQWERGFPSSKGY